MKVHHIGYLVRNIEKSMRAFEAIGYTVKKETVFDQERKSEICFMEMGGYCVELIAPAKDSTLFPLLKQYSNAPYHMCYKCTDLQQAISKLQKEKFLLFLEPAHAPAIGENAKVAFLLNAHAGMIELLEE